YLTQPVLDAVQQLRPIAQRAGITLSQMALAWTLREQTVTSAIVGATSPNHILDNVAAGDVVLDAQTIADIDRILIPVAPTEPYLA
ncbi:MAG TPA: aldo/keto reductase, partial [Candidatus Aquilonibacter sp.]